MSFNNVIIKDWRKIDLSFGLIYPNIFRIGMSSYSIRLLYSFINSFENIACERIFLPEIKITFPASKDYSQMNLIRSIENRVQPIDFDILGFSLHFENDLKNILWLLEKANIPLTFSERQVAGEKIKDIPLIIGGGPVITSNPIPFSRFFDILFIGDSEPNLELFFEVFLEFKNNQSSYSEFLENVRRIEGIFIPSLGNKVRRAVLKNLSKSPNPTFQLISKIQAEKKIFGENFFVEINRGCPYQCKFCISSFHNSPFRNRNYENIINIIENGIKNSSFNVISLLGSCVSSHPKFKQICEYIIKTGKRLTLPSIRIEHLNNEIIQILEKGNIKTITLAPETGSETLRYALGKMISNDKIFSILTHIRESEIKNVKLYFLIGLPNETYENIHEIIRFLKNIINLGFEKNTLKININPFIPKLNTPFEKEVDYYYEKNKRDLIKKYQLLEKELRHLTPIKLKITNFKMLIKNARLQTMISLGDEKISHLLLNYYFNGATFSALQKSEKEMGFILDEYLSKIRNCYNPWNVFLEKN